MELDRIVEVEYEGFGGKLERDIFEVYRCDKVKLITDSANGYWHDRSAYETDPYLQKGSVIDTARIWISGDGGFNGGFKDYSQLTFFFAYYLRAKLVATVTA